MDDLRKYLGKTIHDPRIAEPVEDELDDMTPFDADDTPAEPYLEGETTVNDSTFPPYSVAPDDSPSHAREYTLSAHPAATPLPPSQQLHRTQPLTGTLKSRLEGSRPNGNGLYATIPPAQMEHLGAPCWVAPGTTQDSRGTWETSHYGHSEAPYGE